ncbi:MAG: carbohydrate ABC transporter permease [Mycobacterium sp.]|nr:carbohydrate ABC transporter permease [Mycobacterium sp.]
MVSRTTFAERRFAITGIKVTRRAVFYGVLCVLGVLFILPFLWMLSTSLKLDPQVYHVPPSWIPNPIIWRNYPNALTYLPFDKYFFNTMTYCVGVTIGTVISAALVAYGFSRVRWRGRDAIFWIVLATMMLPFQVQMIPLYITFKNLHWLNTYLPLVVPAFFGSSAFSIFLLRQFFRTIPMELSDAARVDGANEMTIFLRIILPLAKPALAVVALFQFMDGWNDFLGPLIYLNDSDRYPLALGLQQLQTAFNQGTIPQQWPQLMAASTVVMVPVLVIYFFTQRVFVQGIVVSGMKS